MILKEQSDGVAISKKQGKFKGRKSIPYIKSLDYIHMK